VLFLVTFQNSSNVRIVPAVSLEALQEKYPNCQVYRYRETNNPVTAPNDDNGLWRITERVIPNMSNNKWCVFS
jgi:hypothetical protein